MSRLMLEVCQQLIRCCVSILIALSLHGSAQGQTSATESEDKTPQQSDSSKTTNPSPSPGSPVPAGMEIIPWSDYPKPKPIEKLVKPTIDPTKLSLLGVYDVPPSIAGEEYSFGQAGFLHSIKDGKFLAFIPTTRTSTYNSIGTLFSNSPPSKTPVTLERLTVDEKPTPLLPTLPKWDQSRPNITYYLHGLSRSSDGKHIYGSFGQRETSPPRGDPFLFSMSTEKQRVERYYSFSPAAERLWYPNRCRGICLEMPEWWRKRVGYSHLLGSGGRRGFADMGHNDRCSFGFCFAATNVANKSALDIKPIVYFSVKDPMLRAYTYSADPGDGRWMTPDRTNKGRGRFKAGWTADDGPEGATCFVDTADGHAILSLVTFGSGKVDYVTPGNYILSERYDFVMASYAPERLDGTNLRSYPDFMVPWQVLRDEANPAARPTGLSWDRESETLGIYVPFSIRKDGEKDARPAIYLYSLKPN